MDAKLNQSDLISLLAKESNISVAKAELFTKSFFDLIIEGLEQDGIVKINGLGTFRITDVASRGSVNVNTGEKIEIKGHKKLTFIPADALKECVNQPFAMFEPVEVDDSYQPDYADDAETDDAAEPVENESITEVVIVTPSETQTETDEAAVDDTHIEEAEQPQTEYEPVAETVPSADAEEINEEETTAPVATEEKEQEPVVDVEPAPVVVQERPAEPVMVRVPEKKEPTEAPVVKKKTQVWRYAIIGLVAIVAAYFGYTAMNALNKDSNAVEETVSATIAETKQETVTVAGAMDVVGTTDEVTTNDSAATVTDENVATNENAMVEESVTDEIYLFTLVDELAATRLKDISVADTTLYVADGELVRHTVAPDETLTKISRKYFGDKRLWPYIVKYNNMTDPNGLCCGMEIAVPRLKPRK